MLIDEFVPVYDFREYHEVTVRAPHEVVRSAADAWRPDSSPLWRVLLLLRGLGRPHGSLREWAEASGFLCLADTPEEVVYGQAGRFWSLNERAALVSPRTVDEFRAFADPDCAVAVLNVRFEALAPDRTRLSTETKVRALGPSARRRFRLYWLLIRPFSGLLRRSMLRGVTAQALAAYRGGEAV